MACQLVNLLTLANFWGLYQLVPAGTSWPQLVPVRKARIRENQNDLHFTNIYCNLSRQKLLMSAIKRACSSVRNGYREMSATHKFTVRNSVDDDDSKNSTLNDFVYEVANRFHPSNVSRFINTLPFTWQSCGKKRKRVNRQKGGDFWSMVEKWCRTHNLSAIWPSMEQSWLENETVDNDHMRFRPRTVENPYLADFEPGVGTGTTDTEGPGNAGGHICGELRVPSCKCNGKYP
ncbi:hypothetical protein EDB84DRAFT_1433393 [Lactarius hengduanensis]|nr:hypothetical protein EDB84DRAFT_1433393 [Lactarius hengduanensis]